MKQFLNRRHLKIIAAISMLIDHLTVFLENNAILNNYNVVFALRAIGRIAFPLYAFMFVEGLLETRNKKKHLLMFLIISLITEPVFDKTLFGQWVYTGHQNVIFLFLIMAIGLYLIELLPKGKELTAVFFMLPASMLVIHLNVDYSVFGVFAVSLFYILRKNKIVSILSIIITFLFEANMYGLVYLSIPILLSYNGKEPKLPTIEKRFYQYFYPLHLGVLALISCII